MAKVIGKFEIVIVGDTSGPTKTYRRYTVKDSVNTELQAKRSTESNENFNKTLHNTGAVGEFWKDEVAAAETAEGI